MTKIDYTKVEERLSQTLHCMFVKKLMGSEPSVSIRAVTYFGMGDGPRPKREDPVETSLTEIKDEAKKELMEEKKKKLTTEATEIVKKDENILEKPIALPKENVALKIPEIEKVPVIEDKLVPTSPLFILKKHLDWLKKSKIKDRYKLLGTSKEEIEEIYKKEVLTEEIQKRVEVLLKKSEDLKSSLSKQSGLDDDATLIELERKKHINKRHNVRSTWIPLQ